VASDASALRREQRGTFGASAHAIQTVLGEALFAQRLGGSSEVSGS
jgi:hypothetical protein